MKRLRPCLISLLTLTVSACGGGGSSSSSTPTSPTTPQRATVSILDLKATSVRSTDGFEITATMRLQETGGVGLVGNTMTFQFVTSAGTAYGSFVADLNGARLPANTVTSTVTVVMSAAAETPFPAALRVTLAFTDDKRNAGTATAEAPVDALPTLATGAGAASRP